MARSLMIVLSLVASALLLLSLGGCGSSAKVEAKTTTVGKELQDLEDARNKGLLTEEEYQDKRKDILNRN